MKKIMRELISLFLMWCVLICGCGMIQLNQTEQDLATSIMARRIGYTIAEQYPVTALRIAPMAETLIANDDVIAQIVAGQIRTVILSDISDPMLRADIKDLMGLITIKGPDVEEYQIKLIRIAASGLLMGLNNE